MGAMNLERDACYRAIQARDRRFDGRLFVAVRTTGVYCRPICPARTPRLENVVFYASAAAAHEAGFRPCLRCRPEVSPHVAAWQGTSRTVSRALALIGDGALDGDDSNVDRLASRLGMGERQLRRLFHRHVGASPIAVAQTRRFLFAKQLVHETRLSMTEIALASGFGSLRRFNDSFRSRYGRAPSTLRLARSAKEPEESVAAGGIRLSLGYVPPYDWQAMFEFFSARAIPGVEVVEPESYLRTIEIGGRFGMVQIGPMKGRDALAVTIRFPDVQALPTIVARLRRMFDLDADVSVIAAHLGEDPVLAPLVAARPGLRVPGAWDGFELAVRALLGQQITVRAARGLAAKLVARYGSKHEDPADSAESGLERHFPRPQDLIGADPSSFGMPLARGRALVSLAEAAAESPELFASDVDLEHSVERLRRLPGIGDWTAQYIALRALREPDAFPASDVGLLRSLAAITGSARLDPAELAARARAWRPWRGYAAQHLWSAEPPKSSR